MRYAVEDMLTWLSAGMTHEQILQDYPDLVLEDILASLAYAAAGTTCSRARRHAASLTALKAEIGQGMADIEARRIKEAGVESIKKRGRAAQSRTNAIGSTRNRPRL